MVCTTPSGDMGTGFIDKLDNLQIRALQPGDATGDGAFDSTDIPHVFQVGEYGDTLRGNSTFAESD